MNFFEHQDRARRQTTRLVVYFVIAVVLIVAAVNLAAYGIMRLSGSYDRFARDAAPVVRGDRNYPGRFVADRMPSALSFHAGATIATLLLVVGGSMYKTASLASGGPAVAQLMGGRPIRPELSREAVLQNVVEEMSIASGVPVPQVYVMEAEDGINAFAAGFTTDDAVIGVTRGTIEKLTRDELQGVVAHEFSHILNGDMRLNLRLIGILHGILLLALIGMMVLRSVSFGRYTSRRSRNGGGILLLLLAAAALIVIGYVGVFFGRLIQAAVSRQREFLADASAVQFTRNPRGLAGALSKIARHMQSSRVQNAHALETAHLFFSNAFAGGFTRLFATHPPLEDRIKAIDPTFAAQTGPDLPDTSGPPVAGTAMFAGRPHRIRVDPAQVADRAGVPTPGHVTYAQGLLSAIPPALSTATEEPFGARAVVFALLASDDSAVRGKQLALIERNIEPECFSLTRQLLQAVALLDPGARLPVVERSLPALRQLSPAQMARFRAVVRAMIDSDGRVTLFEYTLARILGKHLGQREEPARRAIKWTSVSSIRREAALLLSALSAASSRDTDRAFEAGARTLDPDKPPQMLAVAGLKDVDLALNKLAESSPAVKKRLIDAAAQCIAADGEISVAESELLRATAAALDVPLPPML